MVPDNNCDVIYMVYKGVIRNQIMQVILMPNVAINTGFIELFIDSLGASYVMHLYTLVCEAMLSLNFLI